MTTPTATHQDMQFLRTIPEDRSDLASSLALAPASAKAANSSVRGLDAGREGSIVSSARADLAEEAQRRPTIVARGGRHRRRKCSPSSPCVLVSTFLVVMGAIIAIVLVTVSDDSDSPAMSPNRGGFPPTIDAVDPATVQALDDMLNKLVTMPVERDTAAANDPRLRAREWMLTEDLLRDDLLQAQDEISVLQRFVLVEFYYATQGDVSWTKIMAPTLEGNKSLNLDGGTAETTVPFLTPQASECTWEGISCETDADNNELVYKISLSNRNLTGTLPESLYALPDLGEISLANNNVTGPLKDLWFDDTVGALPKLFVLDLDSNALTGTIPKALWSRPNIRFVYLNHNKLSGSVFDGVDKAGEFLQIVWLHENKQLTGPLPSWLFTLEWLTTFWADDNQFTGSLPEVDVNAAVHMPSLEWLTVKHNRLTGSLQSHHLAGQSLQTLHLNNNALTGTLPVVGEDAAVYWPLQDLWLHNNQFSGAIPTDFGLAWPDLRDLRLTNNSGLTGDISQAQCDAWTPRGEDQIRYDVDCPPITCSGRCCQNEKSRTCLS